MLKNSRKIIIALFTLIVLMLSGCGENREEGTSGSTRDKVIHLATTTSVNDSGLLGALKPIFETDTGYELDILSQGTGQALQTAANGDADAVLIHAKESEEEFVNAGYGLSRIELMYNYFVIVGPRSDPAQIRGSRDAADAYTRIAEFGATFVSRGDDSGTHKKEMKIWDAAGLTPEGDWYMSVGDGMGATLIKTDENRGYTMTDKSTYLAMKDKLQLDILVGESEDMKNIYSLIAVNPEKFPDINKEGAKSFIDFCLSEKGKNLISEYGKAQYGQPLFFLIDKP